MVRHEKTAVPDIALQYRTGSADASGSYRVYFEAPRILDRQLGDHCCRAGLRSFCTLVLRTEYLVVDSLALECPVPRLSAVQIISEASPTLIVPSLLFPV
jgi:hypothetical protein